MKTLEEKCLSLPYWDRLRICNSLQASIRQERRDRLLGKPSLTRLEVLNVLMEELLGEPVRNSRDSIFVWARAMIAHQLLSEGWRVTEVARLMGRSHATIIFHRRKVEDAIRFPAMYRSELALWKEFQKKIREYDIQQGTNGGVVLLAQCLPNCGEGTMVSQPREECTEDHTLHPVPSNR